jgi:hypothetical protein
MSMGEALAAGLYVAEADIDDVIRCYGRTPEEARARTLAEVAANVKAQLWTRDPDGRCSKADGTVHYR